MKSTKPTLHTHHISVYSYTVYSVCILQHGSTVSGHHHGVYLYIHFLLHCYFSLHWLMHTCGRCYLVLLPSFPIEIMYKFHCNVLLYLLFILLKCSIMESVTGLMELLSIYIFESCRHV